MTITTITTERVTENELRQIIASHEKGHCIVIRPLADYRMAKELLAAREAVPVGYAENGKGFIYPTDRRDRIQNPVAVYTAPPAPATQKCECTSIDYCDNCMRAMSARPAPAVPEDYQHLKNVQELYHGQEKRLFALAKRIKGDSFDKYAHSPSQAIDVLEREIFGDSDACRAAMAQHVSQGYKLPDENAIAAALWSVRAEEEDRLDMELEDLDQNHSVFREAAAVIAMLAAAPEGK